MLTLAKIKQLGLPKAPGSYQFYNRAGEIIYIGKAVNLASRVLSYWQTSANHSPMKQKMLPEIEQVKWIEVETEIEALLLEANLVKKFQPYYNVLLRDDKRFAYIWISSADEVPGVFVVRQVNKPGQYFGPFVSGSAVKETVKVLRKIWPYCTTRKLAKQPCFYYQIGRCAGACGSIISREEYLARVIKPIITFLSGEKKKVIRNYELRIKELNKKIKKSASLERESLELELNQAVYELKNMQQVLENSRVLSTAEKFSTDTVELAKVLGLAKIPARIEGYDTSNIFGHQAVASMVTFVDGEADKSGYRKFKLQIPPQADAPRAQQNSKLKTPFSDSKHGDVQFLQEVLTRRLAHAFPTEDKVSEYWPLPDLMIIDGGKAQLNIALKMLKKYQVDLPVIAISKGGGLRSSIARDKIFISGLSAPIELSLNSPALHLVKRVRDESHRFAISFHRDLRSKKFLGKK